MSRHTDRTDAGTATAMGNAEGLVQVQMADIGTKGPRTAQTHLCIEVGAIEVHLTAMAMHQLADAANAGLEHAVGGGVGDHQRRQAVGMLRRASRQILLIDVAVVIAGHRHHLETRHHGTGGIGAMGTGGNQTDIAMVVTSGAMPGPDHEQPGVLPLGTGIGLQRHGCKTRERRKPGFQLLGQALVTQGLCSRGEGVQPGKGRPAHGQQLSGRVELHRAAAERNHPVHQREITTHQALDVTHQLGLAAIAVEHRLCQPGVISAGHTLQLLDGRQRQGWSCLSNSSRQGCHQPGQLSGRGAFIQGDAESCCRRRIRAIREHPQVEPCFPNRLMHRRGQG